MLDAALGPMHTVPIRGMARRPHAATTPDARPPMTGARVQPSASVTELIRDADSNVPQAVNRLFDVLYKDLRRVATGRLHANGRPPELSPTVLLHETYERLVQLKELRVADRRQFFTYAATVMRSVIVDMARARLTERRGGGMADVAITTMLEASLASPLDDSVVQINDALTELAAVEPRLAKVVEMRYFGGLSMVEIAEALELTERTVARDWTKARSLLAAMLA
jgi:RNA polymerase sigma factor (TIGR02999 family)